jgi:hypothetical protein
MDEPISGIFSPERGQVSQSPLNCIDDWLLPFTSVMAVNQDLDADYSSQIEQGFAISVMSASALRTH